MWGRTFVANLAWRVEKDLLWSFERSYIEKGVRSPLEGSSWSMVMVVETCQGFFLNGSRYQAGTGRLSVASRLRVALFLFLRRQFDYSCYLSRVQI
jgi:hypothetical protein